MAVGWDRLSSFPSDTATLFFALSALIFVEYPFIGGLALLWSLFSVGIMRVMIGFHYPSDILGSLVLGPGCVFLIGMNTYVVASFERLLNLLQSRQYIIHGIFFIALAEAYNLFAGLRHVLNGLAMIGKRLIGLH
jgi:undecaprenyl-diphosphatase